LDFSYTFISNKVYWLLTP